MKQQAQQLKSKFQKELEKNNLKIEEAAGLNNQTLLKSLGKERELIKLGLGHTDNILRIISELKG